MKETADDEPGQVNHYAEWQPRTNPSYPAPWEFVKRVDIEGVPHFDIGNTGG